MTVSQTIHKSFMTHLEAAIDGTQLSADQIQTLHKGRPLWVRYDLSAVKDSVDRERIGSRPADMWRYRELLPPSADQELVTLGEGWSPLLQCERLGSELGARDVWIKDESRLPTGSFKARGIAMALTMARRFGVTDVAIPTAGNAGGATAAYAAQAGMRATVFMPDDTPTVNQQECALFGARVFLVNGLITDCGKIVREGVERTGWFDLSTLKEPYRIEGKKTMGLELAEQLGWKLPDVILYPTGGGTGLIGMWKAFNELRELGWLESAVMPRMISVQSDGCCPIVRAFENGERFAEPFENAHTIASGLRVPAAVGDFMILDAIRESGGCAVAVSEERIPEWQRLGASLTGVSVCPETAACVGALQKLLADGRIQPDEHVVIFNTGAAQKYSMNPSLAAVPRRIDIRQSIDWSVITPQ